MASTLLGLPQPDDDGDPDKEERLATFGLDLRACHAIMAARAEEAARAPVRGSNNAAGVYGYQGALAEFDVQLDELEYERHEVLGLPFFVNESRRVSLTVTSGNRYVGVRRQRALVATSQKKGPVTRCAVMRNSDPMQLSLDILEPTPAMFIPDELRLGERDRQSLVSVLRYNMWHFLTFFDSAAGEVRAQFALSRDHVLERPVEKWHRHIDVPSYHIPVEVVHSPTSAIDFILPPKE